MQKPLGEPLFRHRSWAQELPNRILRTPLSVPATRCEWIGNHARSPFHQPNRVPTGRDKVPATGSLSCLCATPPRAGRYEAVEAPIHQLIRFLCLIPEGRTWPLLPLVTSGCRDRHAPQTEPPPLVHQPGSCGYRTLRWHSGQYRECLEDLVRLELGHGIARAEWPRCFQRCTQSN
ncbi:hypothetical protein VTK26DRAFT_6815 [Humicola hyalothermophila]